MSRRYLPMQTEYNGQLRSAIVIELQYRQVTSLTGEWIVSDITDLATLQAEPANTIYLPGILRGNLHIGTKACDLYLEIPSRQGQTSVIQSLASVMA